MSNGAGVGLGLKKSVQLIKRALEQPLCVCKALEKRRKHHHAIGVGMEGGNCKLSMGIEDGSSKEAGKWSTQRL